MTAYADKLNITSITDNVAPANSLALGYNKPNRLQSAAGPWGTKTFTYDGTGNRTSEVTGATTDTLSYPATSNRISNVLTGVTTSRTFTHDGAGNPGLRRGRHRDRHALGQYLHLRLLSGWRAFGTTSAAVSPR